MKWTCMMKEENRALSKCKVSLMLEKNSVFYSTIVFSLESIWDTSIPTASTNGLNLKINPEWFMALSPKQRIGLVVHEANHVALLHPVRLGNRDHKVFNMAADHMINLMLLGNGFELPEGGLHDSKYTDMSTDEIYNILIKDATLQNSGGGSGGEGSGEYDCDIQATTGTPNEVADIESRITDTLIRAITQSKLTGEVGDIPGELEIYLDKLLNPKLPWNVILQNYLTSFIKEDYSYRRPNRRYMPEFILPGLYGEGLGEIAFGVDTSGSVTDDEFLHMVSELHEIKETLKPSKMTIIDFDTVIRNGQERTDGDTLSSIKFTGRGGTSLKPVFNYYTEKQPELLIIFSDLECAPITVDPGFPVIWICVQNPNAKVYFGEKIDYET